MNAVKLAAAETHRRHIDTTPGRDDLFSPSDPVDDYKAWLIERYKRGISPAPVDGVLMSLGGVSQAVFASVHHLSRGGVIVVHGPYQEACREALKQIRANPRKP
ncbi:MAG: hypothetical protein AAF354_10125 [Pseudomonadota bacterium]